jgi:hypothetical protein
VIVLATLSMEMKMDPVPDVATDGTSFDPFRVPRKSITEACDVEPRRRTAPHSAKIFMLILRVKRNSKRV